MSSQSRSAPLLAASSIQDAPPATPGPSLRAIISAAAPAILNNVAWPLSAAAQLAMLGHSRGTHGDKETGSQQVAAFTAITAVVTFVANVANFVVVVTMARVGHALGAKQWTLLGHMVRAVFAAAIFVGVLVGGILMFARQPLLSALSLGDRETAEYHIASSYLPAALLRLPLQLVLRAASSVLVGYQRVRLASAVNTLLALADTLAFYVVLHVLHSDLRTVGFVVAATCGCAAFGALLLVLSMPPHPSVRIFCGCRAAEKPPKDPAVGSSQEGDGCVGSSPNSPPSAKSLRSLACDSLNVLIRSLLLSGSVLSLTVAVAPLGTAALNAHAVVLQLWMITSYVVDGFADAGTMIGSRLLGAGEAHHMRSLTLTLALLGLGTGLTAAALLEALRAPLAHLFVPHSAGAQAALLHGPLWHVLVALQPINALVFVYDGILYAARSFAYVRNALAAGVLLVFAPSLAVVLGAYHSLLAVWLAKSLLNAWRCLTALFHIHCQLWPTWVAAVPTSTADVVEQGGGRGPPPSGLVESQSRSTARTTTEDDGFVEVD